MPDGTREGGRAQERQGCVRGALARDGRFKQRTFTVRRDAERFALRIEDELLNGNTTDVYVKRGKTVADMVEASLAASAPRLKPRTLASYRDAYDCHVLPVLGQRRICAVT